MDDGGDLKEDLKLPDGELGEEIQRKYDNEDNFAVTVLKAVGEEKIIAIKVLT